MENWLKESCTQQYRRPSNRAVLNRNVFNGHCTSYTNFRFSSLTSYSCQIRVKGVSDDWQNCKWVSPFISVRWPQTLYSIQCAPLSEYWAPVGPQSLKRSQLAAGPFPNVPPSSGKIFMLISDSLTPLGPLNTKLKLIFLPYLLVGYLFLIILYLLPLSVLLVSLNLNEYIKSNTYSPCFSCWREYRKFSENHCINSLFVSLKHSCVPYLSYFLSLFSLCLASFSSLSFIFTQVPGQPMVQHRKASLSLGCQWLIPVCFQCVWMFMWILQICLKSIYTVSSWLSIMSFYYVGLLCTHHICIEGLRIEGSVCCTDCEAPWVKSVICNISINWIWLSYFLMQEIQLFSVAVMESECDTTSGH